jgi:hypothetical protein
MDHIGPAGMTTCCRPAWTPSQDQTGHCRLLHKVPDLMIALRKRTATASRPISRAVDHILSRPDMVSLHIVIIT